MRFNKFSNKQLIVLTWWKNEKLKNKKGIICDGSIRSGKSLSMSISFLLWAMETFNGQQLGMSGKTIGGFERNVIFWLIPVLKSRGMKVKYNRKDALLTVTAKIRGSIKTNYFYVFGGKDESSYSIIQGMTAAGWYFDEVALQPQSFVNQAIGRCSVEGSKIWFNCNPDSPIHWFKINFIDKINKLDMIHLHFTMEDNPSLSDEVKHTYESRFSGVFYLRYILGLWSLAEGIIYSCFDNEKNLYDKLEDNIKLESTRYLSIDYGISNPFVVLDIYDHWNCAYLEDEIYYDSKNSGETVDTVYAEMIEEQIKKSPIPVEAIIIDPSAESLKVLLRNRGYRVKDANNEVHQGIVCTSSALYQNKYLINSGCKNTIKEIGGYVWDEKAKLRGEEKPVKINDHAMDAMRYFINTIMRKRILERI